MEWSQFVSFVRYCCCFIHFYLTILNVACYHLNCSKIDWNKPKHENKLVSTKTKIESHFLKNLRKCSSNVYAVYIKTMATANTVKKFSLYYQTTFKTNIRGHHIYKNIWTSKLNKILRAKHNTQRSCRVWWTCYWNLQQWWNSGRSYSGRTFLIITLFFTSWWTESFNSRSVRKL